MKCFVKLTVDHARLSTLVECTIVEQFDSVKLETISAIIPGIELRVREELAITDKSKPETPGKSFTKTNGTNMQVPLCHKRCTTRTSESMPHRAPPPP